MDFFSAVEKLDVVCNKSENSNAAWGASPFFSKALQTQASSVKHQSGADLGGLVYDLSQCCGLDRHVIKPNLTGHHANGEKERIKQGCN